MARSTFTSQNVQNTPFLDHLWKLRCPKGARRCGAKHISKSKCTKQTILGALLEVEMSKKCTPLWCEAHFQVKMYKTHHSWTTFGSWDVEKVHADVVRSTLRCGTSARRCGAKHVSKSKVSKTDGLGALLDVQMPFCVAGARNSAPSQKVSQNMRVLSHFQTQWQACDMFKGSCKDAFCVTGAVLATC